MVVGVNNILENLYSVFIDELNDLSIGYPYNLNRLSYMRALISIIIYLRYAVLSDKDILKILQSYEHI
jgi:hypothetical protein